MKHISTCMGLINVNINNATLICSFVSLPELFLFLLNRIWVARRSLRRREQVRYKDRSLHEIPHADTFTVSLQNERI